MGDQQRGQTTMRRDVRMLMNPYKKEPGTADGSLTRGGIIEMVLSRQQNDIKKIQMALCETPGSDTNDEITNDDAQSNDDSETSGFGSSESPTASESSQSPV